MELLSKLCDAAPLLALFITVGLGYIAGKFKVGRFLLGGIAGTLLVGVLIGQLGIKAVLAASLSNLMSAALAGIMLTF